MFKIILIVICGVLVCFSSLFAQAKVGTTGAQFLELSPSVKANGMGQVGVAVANNKSYALNPASFGSLVSQRQFSLSFYPTWSMMSAGVKTFYLSLSFPVYHKKTENADFFLSGTYYQSKLKSGTFTEPTTNSGTINGTGRVFQWEDESHNFLLNFVRLSAIDFAGGVTVKYIKQTSHEYSANGYAFDIGMVVRYPMKSKSQGSSVSYMTTSVGVAVLNIGPAMTFISQDAPLPLKKSLGFGFEMGNKREFVHSKSADIYRFNPAIDIGKFKDDEWEYKFGLDVSLYELINFRIGNISSNTKPQDEFTYGFTISTFNIGKFRLFTSNGASANTGGLLGFLYNKLQIEYNFANYDRHFITENQHYHEFVLSYKL